MPHERRRKTRRAKKQKQVEEEVIEQPNTEEENYDYTQDNQYDNENYENYDNYENNVDNKKKLFDVNNWDNDVQAHYGRPSPDILQYFSNIEKMLTEQEFENEEGI